VKTGFKRRHPFLDGERESKKERVMKGARKKRTRSMGGAMQYRRISSINSSQSRCNQLRGGSGATGQTKEGFEIRYKTTERVRGHHLKIILGAWHYMG